MAVIRHAREKLVALETERRERDFFLRSQPCVIEAAKRCLRPDEKEAVHDGEDGGDARQDDATEWKMTRGAQGEKSLKNEQQRNGQIERGDLTFDFLVGAPEIFWGTENIFLELLNANRDIVKCFFCTHLWYFLAHYQVNYLP